MDKVQCDSIRFPFVAWVGGSGDVSRHRTHGAAVKAAQRQANRQQRQFGGGYPSWSVRDVREAAK